MINVLIVEDDPMVAMINEQYVHRVKGFAVAGHCRDGKSALEFLARTPVDLVILDVYMPAMDGLETLRQLRKQQASVEAIMVTAANDRASLEEALHLGVVDYLVKPFVFERFKMALDKFTAQRQALGGRDLLNQQNIDHIIDSAHRRREELRPKGIQEQTLQMLLEHLQRQSDWQASDEIAAQTGLTGVTVRRYLNYLVESGDALGEMNYETGGRPCMMYRVRG